MKNINVTIEKYNQKGEGVGFIEGKPIYIFGAIKNEEILCEIISDNKTYFIGKLIEIIKPSKNRSEYLIKDAHKIGGYDLLHMNEVEQQNFKIERLKNDLKKIGEIEIENINFIRSPKQIKYRNKITVVDGMFIEKGTNENIEIDDYLLSDIEIDPLIKGKIVYRKLDTLISGEKKEKKYTTDTLLDYKFRVGLGSFYQINKEVMELIYKEIKENIIPEKNTLDMYSGIGTITIIASKKSKMVFGVERSKPSYKDALYNIKKNKIKNIHFYNQSVLPFLKNEELPEIETLILDPSREGVGKKELEIIVDKIKPKRIIYMSCSPSSLANNLKFLKSNYSIESVKIFDMFPQTFHIESLTILNLK